MLETGELRFFQEVHVHDSRSSQRSIRPSVFLFVLSVFLLVGAWTMVNPFVGMWGGETEDGEFLYFHFTEEVLTMYADPGIGCYAEMAMAYSVKGGVAYAEGFEDEEDGMRIEDDVLITSDWEPLPRSDVDPESLELCPTGS